jgi:zinc protease
VNQAIDNITGSFPLSIASNGDIVGQLGAIGFYHLPTDYLTQFVDSIRQVTPAMVKAAMQKVIDPQAFTLVSVGPKALTWPPQLTDAHDHPQK